MSAGRQVRVWDEGKKTMVFVGVIVGTEFHRNVKKTHFMRVVQGYGLQSTAIGMLTKCKVEKVVLHHEDGYTLTSTLVDWLQPDVSVIDLGHGMQRFLPQNRMLRSGDAHKDEELF